MRVIAIDGPAGAGKSTIARAVASRLGLHYLDTGAQYRSVAVAAIRRAVDLADADAVAAVARSMTLDVDENAVVIDGVDSGVAIRSPEASQGASRVAVNQAVRAEMQRRQRQWALDHGGGVIEGRDIGSVVFPDADLKLYLTASPEVRAGRRHHETGEDLDDVLASIRERDARDASRRHDPLMQADGATVIDTSNRSIEQLVEEIVAMLKPAP